MGVVESRTDQSTRCLDVVCLGQWGRFLVIHETHQMGFGHVNSHFPFPE